MKNIVKLFMAIALLVALALPAMAAPEFLTGFSVGTTNQNATPSYAIVPANSKNGGTPFVTSLTFGSDKAASRVTTYRVVCSAPSTMTNSTVTFAVANNAAFTNTAGMSTNAGVIIIRHLADETCEKRILAWSGVTGTNLVVTVAPMQTILPGDIIYGCVSAGAAIVPSAYGISTNTITGSPVLVGQPGKPLLLEVDLTSSGGLYNASGYWAQ